MEKRWQLLPEGNQALIDQLAKELSIHRVLATLLVRRGIKNFSEARDFFRPTLEQLHNPMLMRDMEKAVARIEKALLSGEKILVYGDYDVDGTTAVALVYTYLRTLNAQCDFYIPDRYKEGYGISFTGIEYAAAHGYSLIIALDCGIKAVEKIKAANDLQVDFIICDHHRPGDVLPDAVAVLDPKRDDCPYPFKELSGCGIGFKLVQALAEKRGLSRAELMPYLDFVAVSIAADLVSIAGENRVLAYFGLQRINTDPRPGFRAMIRQQNIKKSISITELVFVIAPRINAAGRLEHGAKAVELLIASSVEQAEAASQAVNKTNSNRKDIDTFTTQQAVEILENYPQHAQRRSTVVFHPSWHKGVVGIVASRLIERWYRPTIVLTESNGVATGSARSVKDFDVYEAIEACGDLLDQFGGHTYAAGLTLKIEQVEKFKERFEEVVQKTILEKSLVPEIEIDAELSLDDVDGKFVRVLRQFAPFGPDNMSPVFCVRGAADRGWARVVGNNHLKMDIINPKTPDRIFPAIGFGLGAHLPETTGGKNFDLCCSLEDNEWNGQTSLQLSVKDMRAC